MQTLYLKWPMRVFYEKKLRKPLMIRLKRNLLKKVKKLKNFDQVCHKWAFLEVKRKFLENRSLKDLVDIEKVYKEGVNALEFLNEIEMNNFASRSKIIGLAYGQQGDEYFNSLLSYCLEKDLDFRKIARETFGLRMPLPIAYLEKLKDRNPEIALNKVFIDFPLSFSELENYHRVYEETIKYNEEIYLELLSFKKWGRIKIAPNDHNQTKQQYCYQTKYQANLFME